MHRPFWATVIYLKEKNMLFITSVSIITGVFVGTSVSSIPSKCRDLESSIQTISLYDVGPDEYQVIKPKRGNCFRKNGEKLASLRIEASQGYSEINKVVFELQGAPDRVFNFHELGIENDIKSNRTNLKTTVHLDGKEDVCTSKILIWGKSEWSSFAEKMDENTSLVTLVGYFGEGAGRHCKARSHE